MSESTFDPERGCAHGASRSSALPTSAPATPLPIPHAERRPLAHRMGEGQGEGQSPLACLTLLLDAPLQAWGLVNTFSNRGTALHPTKGPIIGMICAAMGLRKGSLEEQEWLPKLASLKLTTVTIPRSPPDPSLAHPKGEGRGEGSSAFGAPHSIGRLNDFHTVLGTRRANGKPMPHPVLTQRQYLEDARFGAFLAGDKAILEKADTALRDPVWGIWFGRKCCLPSSPVCLGIAADLDRAWTQLKLAAEIQQEKKMTEFLRVEEVEEFSQGTDSVPDQPLSFGLAGTTDCRNRKHTLRRIRVVQQGMRDES
jgi:CRISPR system Cascade subunit CasD